MSHIARFECLFHHLTRVAVKLTLSESLGGIHCAGNSKLDHTVLKKLSNFFTPMWYYSGLIRLKIVVFTATGLTDIIFQQWFTSIILAFCAHYDWFGWMVLLSIVQCHTIISHWPTMICRIGIVLAMSAGNPLAVQVRTTTSVLFSSSPVQQQNPLRLGGPSADQYPSTCG